MYLTRMHLRDLRCVADVAFEPHPRLNFLSGLNGAGKSSLLEGIHLMAYGRSFRGRVRDGLVRTGAPALEVFLEWANQDRPTRRAGLRHSGSQWSAKLDGEAVDLGTLSAALAVLTFEPGSHALIDGPSEVRRRFLDWGLFHVEPDFLPQWRRHARALRQRNALLKQPAVSTTELQAWEWELADAGERITVARRRYVEALQSSLASTAERLSPGLGPLTLNFTGGWREQDLTLADALLLSRDRDAASGFTSVGPHRANWRLGSPLWPNGEAPSRGQAKLCALACLLAQGEHFQRVRGEAPIFLLDDLGAELDRRHQDGLLAVLAGNSWQVIATGTELPEQSGTFGHAVFHVEQGRVRPG